MRNRLFLLPPALALILSLAACGAPSQVRQGTGLRNNSLTVSQLLEDAAAETQAAEAPSAPPPETPAPVPETPAPPPSPSPAAQRGGIDIDLTQLNSTMVYSEVYSMMAEPAAYAGRTVRLSGYCASGYYEPTDTTYYAVIIPDAAACCAQGIEYTLSGGAAYPADDTEIVITGTFELYEDGKRGHRSLTGGFPPSAFRFNA